MSWKHQKQTEAVNYRILEENNIPSSLQQSHFVQLYKNDLLNINMHNK
jgi:hypothetical protein